MWVSSWLKSKTSQRMSMKMSTNKYVTRGSWFHQKLSLAKTIFKIINAPWSNFLITCLTTPERMAWRVGKQYSLCWEYLYVQCQCPRTYVRLNITTHYYIPVSKGCITPFWSLFVSIFEEEEKEIMLPVPAIFAFCLMCNTVCKLDKL